MINTSGTFWFVVLPDEFGEKRLKKKKSSISYVCLLMP